VNFAPSNIPLRSNSRRKCIYSLPAQVRAKHCEKFGWLPLSDVAAVKKPRRENPRVLASLAGMPRTKETILAVNRLKFTILWGHVEEILLLNKFFPNVDTCLSCEDIARQSCAMVPIRRFWRFFSVLHFQRAACISLHFIPAF